MKKLSLLSALLILTSAPAMGDELPVFHLTLKDHTFSPAVLEVPAKQKIKLLVKNEQAQPGEFESGELDREKVVGAGSEITVFLGPLDAGKYGYFDDFHREPVGTIVAK